MKNTKQNKRLNIIALRNELQSCLRRRSELQKRHDFLWEEIRRGLNRQTQMRDVTNQIGTETHKVNCIITQLRRTGQMTHSDCSLARTYLQNEIARNQKIVSTWIKRIHNVERGRLGLINSNGVKHTNTTSVRKYVEAKKRKIAEAQRLLALVR